MTFFQLAVIFMMVGGLAGLWSIMAALNRIADIMYVFQRDYDVSVNLKVAPIDATELASVLAGDATNNNEIEAFESDDASIWHVK